MALKEAAMYKMVNNFGNNGWIWLKFWYNMGAYKGDLWCKLQLPASLIMGVIMNCVCFEHSARFAHMGAQWAQ